MYWTVEIKFIFFVGTSWEKKMKDRKLLSNQHYGTRYHQDSNYLDTYLIKMWLCKWLICTLFIFLRLFLIFLKTIGWLFVSHKGFVILSFWSICTLLLAVIVFIIPFSDVWIYIYWFFFIVQFLANCTIWILVKIFVLLFPIKIFQIFHLMRENINNYLPYPCRHFDIKFGNRLYSKEKRRVWPLLFWI